MGCNTQFGENSLVAGADYVNRITSRYETFSNTEKKLSDFLLSKGKDCVNGSVADFAQRAGVSISSAVRYCKMLGYSGFSELKFRVQQESISAFSDDLAIRSNDTLETAKQKTLQFAYNSIEKTMLNINDASLQKAVHLISEAQLVLFSGAGSAGGVAQLAANQFMVMDIRAFSQPDHLINIRNASYLTSKDVLISINYDGNTKCSVDSIMLAKKQGASTILITSAEHSLSHEYADVILQIAPRNSENALNIVTSTMCQLSVIQTLMIGVWLGNESRYEHESARQRPIGQMVRYSKTRKKVSVGYIDDK